MPSGNPPAPSKIRPQAGCGAGWAEALACVQAHPLSSTPAADDAREQRAYLFFGREAEDELLEALELGFAEVLGEDIGGEGLSSRERDLKICA